MVPSIIVASQAIALIVLSFFLGVAAIVAIRYVGKFPSELDRIGSDLNLYGYGIGLSFVFALEAGRPVLQCLEARWVPLVTAAALLLTVILYAINLYISHKIRTSTGRRYPHGIETWENLQELLGQPGGRRLFRRSLQFGFFPTLALILLDIFGGK